MPQARRIGRDIDTGLEPGEVPGPARERCLAARGRKIELDMAGRSVAGPGVEDDVGVQRASLSRLCVDDLRTDLDLLEAR
jgi:hypothetical protein